MIEAEDLRIGNWVQDEHFRTGVVKRVAEHSVSVKMQHSTLRRDSNHDFDGLDIEPIELTEDIIEKCGFKKDDFITREFNKKGDYNFRAINHYENGFLIIYNFLQGGIMTKHLHQLQNLFYCLTGKELEITL